ncbi:hypothetical protein H0H81_004509 [Sphagnurus paluster]|uniref:Uncharacterized protein n=1 Tax=Sphagnurus paluster TaxID=117069 RepID=A0A9P7G1Y0_9AGAR|nr:hypothetical protein H0H81_004509 [Sphagnurus paluster]
MGVLERRSPAQIKEKFSDLYIPALVTNWKVWPVAQLWSPVDVVPLASERKRGRKTGPRGWVEKKPGESD